MGEVTITRFDPTAHSGAWDSFITGEAVNSTFIHLRDYMDYHADRFDDFSLLATDHSGKIKAVLPATKEDDTVSSHPGLTFGGLLTSKRLHHRDIEAILTAIVSFLRETGVKSMEITQPPYLYHRSRPAGDIDYLLATRLNGTLSRRRLLSAIDLQSDPEYSKLRKRCLKKAEKLNRTVAPSHDIEAFYSMLSVNLADRYNARPVHSLDEIKLLMGRFPDNIGLYMAFDGKTPIAGTILYKSDHVVKTQYIASNPKGREDGAVDMLLMTLIDLSARQGYRYFDLGSSESAPSIINSGLIFQKEGFDAGGVCLDTYKIDIN